MIRRDPAFGTLDLSWDDSVEAEATPSGVRRTASPEDTRVVPGHGPKRRPSDEMTRVVGEAKAAGGASTGPRSDPRAAQSRTATISDPRLDYLRQLYASDQGDAALRFAEGIAEPEFEIHVEMDASDSEPSDSAGSYAEGDHPADRLEGTAVFAPQAALMQVSAMSGTPFVALRMSEVQRLPLDHRAGFLMSMIDGESSIADLCDLAGMPEDEVVSVLTELARHSVIAFK